MLLCILQDQVTYTVKDVTGDDDRFYLEEKTGNILLIKSLVGATSEYRVRQHNNNTFICLGHCLIN